MNSRLVGLHHVALPFPGTPESIDEARRFYSGALGLDELHVPEALATAVLWFAVGYQEIHLFGEPSGVAVNDQTRRHPCFETDDLASLRGRLRDAGLNTIDGTPVIEGRPRFFVIDPFGNALEFLELLTE